MAVSAGLFVHPRGGFELSIDGKPQLFTTVASGAGTTLATLLLGSARACVWSARAKMAAR